MGDEFFWVGIFALQGIILDVLLVIGAVIGVVVTLYLWVTYKINMQKNAEQQKLRETVEAQTNRLLRDIEGL